MKKKILYSAIGVAVVICILYIATKKDIPQPQVAQPIIPIKSIAVATSSSSVPSNHNNVAAILTTSIDHYAQLLASGKQIIGDTQYSNAADGVSALNDPNSPASQLSALRINSCIKNDIGANAMNAYRQADNSYSGSSSETLNNWNEDVNNAASDICLWMTDAVDWQIKKASTAQLHTDEAKITTDLAKARADLKPLAK